MKKTALLFGNNNYESQNCKLDCAINDAELLSSKLTQLGFTCHCFFDQTIRDMGIHIAEFKKELEDNEVGLFYFAGHGFEIESINYLTGVDTGMQDRDTIQQTSYKLNDILDVFRNSTLGVKIVILDACRSNLPQGIRGSIINSFAPISAPVGTIIAFSTSPGQSALEMPDKTNGYYTKSLVENIDKAGIPIEYMFKRVRENLSAYTDKRQISWEHTSLLGNFYFNPIYLDNEYSTLYSKETLEDELYISDNSIFGEIIRNLKSYDYYIQRDAILRLSGSDLTNSNKEELFILGRNIYQASVGGCYNAQKYIDQFHKNTKKYQSEINFHILNGMLYELYFNNNGNLRDQLKTGYYTEILKLVEQHNEYKPSLSFIQNALSQYTDQLLYIPGTYTPIELIVDLAENKDEDRFEYERFYVKQIYCQGHSVLYDETGMNPDTSRGFYPSITDVDTFENSIRTFLASPFQMVRFNYKTKIQRSDLIEIRNNFTLRFNSKN